MVCLPQSFLFSIGGDVSCPPDGSIVLNAALNHSSSIQNASFIQFQTQNTLFEALSDG